MSKSHDLCHVTCCKKMGGTRVLDQVRFCLGDVGCIIKFSSELVYVVQYFQIFHGTQMACFVFDHKWLIMTGNKICVLSFLCPN